MSTRPPGDDRPDSKPEADNAYTPESATDAYAETVTPDESAPDTDAYAATMLPAQLATEAVAETDLPLTGSSHLVHLTDSTLEDHGFDARYHALGALGRGGMGEVRLCNDERIGRKVAVKVMRTGAGTDADRCARFLREARVQGQLEHPAIVPVYDLGIGPDGEPYFTMKRLSGLTLAQILEAQVRGDEELVARYSRRKLLTEFSNVCLAIECAHTRGVLHRDLKPSNIMLGDFGEVYVLDWGVAKIASAPEQVERAVTPATSAGADTEETAAGAVLGTPGYMAPEQLRGEVASLDERADVYSLGAILFEILTLESLHPRGDGPDVIRSTLAGVDAHARKRAPARDVPPELEAICVRATALEPDDRFRSVRALHDAVERYLEGDRDLARRRAIADEHALAAEDAARRLSAGEEVETAARRRAMQEAGRALALDPTHERASQLLSRLLLEPPEHTPPEVEAAIEESTAVSKRIEALAGAVAYTGMFLLVPVFLWMGVRDWTSLCLLGVVTAALTVLTWAAATGGDIGDRFVVAVGLLVLAFLTLMSRIFGPFVLVPGAAATSSVGLLFHDRVRRAIVIGVGCVGVLLPATLEWTGILSPTYSFEGGLMVLRSAMLELPAAATYVLLTAGALSIVLVSSIMVCAIRDAQLAAERRLRIQSWHLRQLVPESGAARAPAE